MADRLSPERRSENMRRIRSKGTKPEMIVRRLLYGMGYRYRLHARELPGKPDIVFRNLRKAIFVHGCFWHQHSKCSDGRLPAARPEYWVPKLAGNIARDQKYLRSLRREGWKVLVIWDCKTQDEQELTKTLRAFLKKP